MKKTALATALLIASNTSYGATLEPNAIYDMNILADGVSCFTFGDCTIAPAGSISYITDNDGDAVAASGSADPNFGSAIAGDGLAGNINITTTDDGSGGVNFSVNSYNLDTFLGTAGGNFATMVRDTSTMSGSVDSTGLIILDTTGRTGMAQTFNVSLGESAWNLDTHDATAQPYCNTIETGSNTLFTTGSSTNIDCVQGTDNLTLTGTNLDNSLSAILVSAGNVGLSWGFFDGVPYSEVFSVQFILNKIARDDSISIDQNTSNNILNVLANDLPASGLTISSIDTSNTQGTVQAITSGGSTTLDYTPPADLTLQADTITYTMTDGADTLSATVSITIVDKTAPTISLNGTNPVNVANGSSYTEEGATCSDNFDSDKAATVGGDTVDPNVDNIYVITYDCTDAAGNTATQITRNVVVSTTDLPPVIAINGPDPLDVTVTAGNSNSFTQEAANADVSCTDDRDTPTLTNDAVTVVDTSTLGGPFTITYNCNDSVPQNATPVTRVINVVDNVDPIVTANGANPTRVVVGNSYVEQGANCSDNFDSSPVVSISPAENTVDTSAIGNSTTITYTCTDASNNSSSVTIDVVTISTGPVITLNGANPDTLFSGQTYTEAGAVCSDDVDADKDAQVSGDTVDTSTLGDYTVRYNCTDSDGNIATEVTRTVTVIADTTVPVITLNGSATIELNQGFVYFEPGAVCSDNVDADKDATIAGDTVDTSTVGTYTVKYTCTDSANNIADTVTRTVIIKSTETPPADEEEGNPFGGNAFGCSISPTPTKVTDSTDWLLVASFLGFLAIWRRRSESKQKPQDKNIGIQKKTQLI